MILHFLEAMLVESVAAWQDINVISRIKQILKANGAVMMHCLFHA
jgi:hypothetical protein